MAILPCGLPCVAAYHLMAAKAEAGVCVGDGGLFDEAEDIGLPAAGGAGAVAAEGAELDEGLDAVAPCDGELVADDLEIGGGEAHGNHH